MRRRALRGHGDTSFRTGLRAHDDSTMREPESKQHRRARQDLPARSEVRSDGRNTGRCTKVISQSVGGEAVEMRGSPISRVCIVIFIAQASCSRYTGGRHEACGGLLMRSCTLSGSHAAQHGPSSSMPCRASEHSTGTCSTLGICGHREDGDVLSCAETRPAPSMNSMGLSKLQLVCPQLAAERGSDPHFCCTEQQLDTIQSQVGAARGWHTRAWGGRACCDHCQEPRVRSEQGGPGPSSPRDTLQHLADIPFTHTCPCRSR